MRNDNQNNPSEILNLLNILCSLGDLQIKCESTLNRIKNDRAKYYLRHGLNRRLSIITKNLDFFYSTVPPNRQKPLDDNETCLATMNLNSLYVNICGAIDNMAWTLTHEFNLYSDITDIENAPQKREINLFHKKFLSKIEKINNLFSDYKKYINAKNGWHNELLKSRHPSTHKIPLYVIPSILNKSESEKYDYHQVQHLEETRKLNFKGADEHFNQMNSLGTFIPLFAHDPDVKPSPIYPVIITDCENLTEITNQFLNSLNLSDKK